MRYDIIGDIHGHADKLEILLASMGYRHRFGAWSHPERVAVFVGDLVDRGPGQLEVIDIVRRMIDAGAAKAVMGNHELNAIAFFMAHPEKPGDHLRTRAGSTGVKNRHQHQAFMAAVGEDSLLHREIINWFTTLPLWLELPGYGASPGIRVAHACWDPKSIKLLSPWLAPGCLLTLDHMHDVSTAGHWAHEAVEIITKGPEFRLPTGHFYLDKGGTKRTMSRLKWWDASATTVRQLAVLSPAEAAALPDAPLEGFVRPEMDGAAATFFGHYWMQGSPAPVGASLACVDYSAGTGGDLVAYRWDGELELSASKFTAGKAPTLEMHRHPRSRVLS